MREKEKALSATPNLLDNYEFEKTKRSQFQYETTGEIKESKAKTFFRKSKEFCCYNKAIIV